jgi:hypothetical protein
MVGPRGRFSNFSALPDYTNYQRAPMARGAETLIETEEGWKNVREPVAESCLGLSRFYPANSGINFGPGGMRSAAHFTSPSTFILLTTWVCSNALFSNDTDTCRLMTNAA